MLSGVFLAGDGETGLSERQQVAGFQVGFVVQRGKVDGCAGTVAVRVVEQGSGGRAFPFSF